MAVSTKSALLNIHLAVLLFAAASLFAKWLQLSPFILTLGRSFFALCSLAIVGYFSQQSIAIITRKNWRLIVSSGVLLALHWSSFFLVIQQTSVTIGLLTFATFPLFISVIEPYVFKTKRHPHTVIQALFIFLGIAIVLIPLNPAITDYLSIIIGVFSAFCFAILSIINRQLMVKHNTFSVSFNQNAIASLLLLPSLYWLAIDLTAVQWQGLIVLGVVFTALSHALFNYSLKTISAHSAGIAVSLEPIYGILVASWLLNEPLTATTIVGACLVFTVNIWSAWQSTTPASM